MNNLYDPAAAGAIAYAVSALDAAGVPAKYNRALAIGLGVGSQVLIGFSKSKPVWSNLVELGVILGAAALGTDAVKSAGVKAWKNGKTKRTAREAALIAAAKGLPSKLSPIHLGHEAAIDPVAPGQE